MCRFQLVFGFLPKVVSFGVVYRTQNALFCKGDVFAYSLDEAFHIFSLRLVIHGAGIVYNGQILTFYRRFDVIFFKINKRPYQRHARFVHMRGGREAREPALVQKG